MAKRGECPGGRRLGLYERVHQTGVIYVVIGCALSSLPLLAVGLIFSIHFFNGHEQPEKFPIDTVVLTGGAGRARVF